MTHKPLLSLFAAALIAATAPAFATASPTAHRGAAATPLYGTYLDAPTHFVFVRLPTGFVFVGQDAAVKAPKVYHDLPTGFVFVKLSRGWAFVPASGARAAT